MRPFERTLLTDLLLSLDEVADLLVHIGDMFSKPVDDHFVRLDNHRQASSGCLVIAAKLLKLAIESSIGLLLLIIAGIFDAENIALFISKVLIGVLIEKPQKLPYTPSLVFAASKGPQPA